jgi:hypothetical protein
MIYAYDITLFTWRCWVCLVIFRIPFVVGHVGLGLVARGRSVRLAIYWVC